MSGKCVVVTGAARGIGRATALRFAREGWGLVLVDRIPDALVETSSLAIAAGASGCLLCEGDLRDGAFLESVMQRTEERMGRIDCLVNNAAWRTLETMRTLSLEHWRDTLDVCLTAPAFLSRMAADLMERKGNGGVIVNVSSIMVDRPAGSSPAYIAAKAGLEGLTRELAVTYGRKGIRAVCLRPGYIDTDLSRDYYRALDEEDLTTVLSRYLTDATPLTGPGRAEDVAEAVWWLASPQASFITGTNLTVDGGFTHNLNSYPLKNLHFPDAY